MGRVHGDCLAANPRAQSSPVSILPSPSLTMAQQQIRQNYHEECEALVNKQINMELYASYVYVALANYFNRVDQALPGFACFFKRSSCVVHHHGVSLMEYQAKRGGKVVLQNIIKEIGDMITKIKMVSNGTGLFTLDQELQKAVVDQTLVDLQNMVAKVKH